MTAEQLSAERLSDERLSASRLEKLLGKVTHPDKDGDWVPDVDCDGAYESIWDAKLSLMTYYLARRVIATEKLVDALKEAGDVIEFYHKFTGVDIGDISRMPFYDDTITKVDTALTAYREASKGV